MNAVNKGSTPAEFFEANSYVLLSDVLSTGMCKNLTQHLFDLDEAGTMVVDEQCPKSKSIYGDPQFDALLQNLAGPIGQHIGIELLPTYTYARLYAPGEVLPIHVDRPACEISGTLTMGFEGLNVWPIYFGSGDEDNPIKLDLQIGDMAMYRGTTIEHWRPEFKGKWQCQIFFHFVDANGPYKDHAFDNREELGTAATNTKAPSTESTVEAPDIEDSMLRTIVGTKEQSRDGVFPIYGGVMIPSWDLELPGAATYVRENYPALTFTPEECDAIVALADTGYSDKGTIGAGDQGKLQKQIRDVELYKVPLKDETKWVFDRLARLASIANNEYYDFEIMGITHELQLLHYKIDDVGAGHYDWHQDVGPGPMCTRKISMSIQLSDPDDYTGCELILNNNGEHVTGTKQQGSIVAFPSYFMHSVTPIDSGDRWALVIWVHGSKRFR